MKKIAYVVDSKIPSREANSVHAVKMAKAFSGISDVTLFCKELSLPEKEALAQYGVHGNFNIVGTNNKKFSGKLKILSDGRETAVNVKKQGKFDVIYGRSAVSLFFLRRYAPFMFEAHEWPTSRMMYSLQKIMFKSDKFAGLVTITGALKEKYLKEFSFLKAEDVVVLQDASDAVSDFSTKKHIDNDTSKYPDVVIGYLGHLYPGKCMEIVIELAKKRPDYLFHIAGGTDEMVSFWNEKLIADNVTNVVLYGFVDNKDVGAWYNAFDVFLLPLKKDVIVGNGKKNIGSWISPLKLFEAMAHGKAIICSDLPTLKEVLVNGKDAVIVSSEDVDEWATALDKLVSDEAFRCALGINAKEKLESRYTWQKRAEKILERFSL